MKESSTRWLWAAILGFLFSAVSIQISLRKGSLSVPITYDDIVYLNDAMLRLQSVARHGFSVLIPDFIANPPHSPYSTAVAFLGFGLLGPHDWAPYAISALFVIGLLATAGLGMKKASIGAFVCVCVAILAWPVTSMLLLEGRPDIVCALLTAYGTLTIVRRPWSDGTRAHRVRIAVVIGLAIIAKPAISPLTVALFGFALLLAAIGERKAVGLRRFVRASILPVCVTFLIAISYFAFAWRDVWEYIVAADYSSTAHLWRPDLSGRQTVLFYLTGGGGHWTMGPWLWATLACLLFAWVGWKPLDGARLARLAVMTFVVYLSVTIPAHKGSFIGIVVTCVFLFYFIWSAAFIVERLTEERHLWTLRAFLAALVIFSVLSFHWHWFYRSGGSLQADESSVAIQRKQLVHDVAAQICAHAKPGTYAIFTEKTLRLNADNVQLDVLKTGCEDVRVYDVAFEPTLEQAMKTIQAASVVVTFSPDDDELLLELPGGPRLAVQNAAIEGDASLKKVAILPSPSGKGAVLIYARQ